MTNPEVPSPVRPALQRSSSDRMLGGVCGGLATYSGLDPVLWRVGMVALTLLGPGVLVYLLLWVLMPTAPTTRPARSTPRSTACTTALDGALSGRR